MVLSVCGATSSAARALTCVSVSKQLALPKSIPLRNLTKPGTGVLEDPCWLGGIVLAFVCESEELVLPDLD